MCFSNFIRPTCVSLHILLAASYLVLLVVWACNIEHARVYTPDQSASVSTHIALVSQAIIVVCHVI